MERTPLRGFLNAFLNSIQNPKITRRLPQLKEFAANPPPSSARWPRARIGSPIEKLRRDLCFRKEPRAETGHVMVQLKSAPQSPVNE